MSNERTRGVNDYRTGTGRYTNPYPIRSQQYNDYEKGWYQEQKRNPAKSIQFFKNQNDITRQNEKQRIQDIANARDDYLRASGKTEY